MSTATLSEIKSAIRDIPDFPKKGILFKDITTLLNRGDLFRKVIDEMATRFQGKQIDKIVGIESRGFLLAAPLAMALGTGFLMLRKKGKLPGITVRHTYALEYGTDTIEIQADAIKKGTRVLLVDDLLATGGTAKATAELVTGLGGQVHALAFLIELVDLKGRDKLAGHQLHTVLKY